MLDLGYFRVFLLAITLCTGCASYPSAAARMTPEEAGVTAEKLSGAKLDWVLTSEIPRGVVVVTHGLNLKPTAMRNIEQSLNAAGMDVLSVSLSGHEHRLDEQERLSQFRHADFSVWQADLALAVERAAGRAALHDVPLYLLGFSLGGLLSADYVNSRPDSEVRAMVLLAPALSLRWSSYLLMPLTMLPNFFLPSVAPEDYRANDYAPVSAYEALYEGLNQFSDRIGAELNIPALVFINPRDELVSPEGLKTFMAEHKLTHWGYHELERGSDADAVLNHLILGPDSLGKNSWEQMRTRMIDFLLSHSVRQQAHAHGSE